MNKLFVSYETAKQLKEKGFDEECIAYFNGNEPYVIPTTGTVPVNEINTHRNTFLHDTKNNLVLTPEENFSEEWREKRGHVTRSKWGIKVAAPMYQQVIDWFREEHKLHFYIETTPVFDKMQPSKYKIMIKVPFQPFKWTSAYYDLGDTYYEALDKSIKRALELI